MIYELILNSTLLVTLAVLYSFVSRNRETNPQLQPLITGILFGGITIIGMNVPMSISPGIFYDGRSIVLALAGLFGGVLSGTISMAMALVYRLAAGGEGIWAGGATIVIAPLIGLLFRKSLRNRPEDISVPSLLLLGLVTHIAMLGCQLLLPGDTAMRIIFQIGLPVLITFPLANLLMGVILRNETRRQYAEDELHKREAQYRSTLQCIDNGIITTNEQGLINYINPSAQKLTGYSEKQAIGKSADEVIELVHAESSEQITLPHQLLVENEKFFHLPEVAILYSNKGIRTPVTLDVSPVRNKLGLISGLIIALNDQTHKHYLRQKLDDSERLFHTLTEKSPVGIFRAKPDGSLSYVNPRWCEISGLNCENAKQNGWSENIHPDDRKKLIDEWNKTITRGHDSKIEFRFIRKDGSAKWVICFVSQELDANNQLVGYIGTIIDIDERKKAERKLVQSHENLQQTMNQFPLGMRIVSSSGETRYVNEAFLKLYEFDTFDDFLRTPVKKRYTAKSLREHEERKIKRKQGIETESSYEVEIVAKTGAIRHLFINRKVILWNNEAEYLTICQDITERKTAEHSLQLLNRAVRQSPNSTVITNEKGEITYTNPKFTEVSGFSADEVIGKKPSVLQSGYHDRAFYAELWGTILQGKEWRGEILNKRKNGELFWENAIISPLFNKKGKITHFIGLKEDITEKKKIIADLQKAKEKAEESDRLKSAFLANMSHEIRTPLNVILGFTNLLVENELTSEDKEQFSAIVKQSSDNLLHIINDILDISKLETGQLVFNETHFIVEPLMLELYANSQQLIKKHNKDHIRLNYHIPPCSISVHTDKGRLSQVFNNLLTNAIKFTREGEINFGAKQVEDGFVEFFVKDSGIGIDKDHQRNIFERFRQVEESNTRTYGGTGLGLSISKKLVEQMGGNIALKSEPGKGSTFTFWIPVN
ncbi:PAS domain S-box protein [Mangrovibacterium marinum]|uniref:Sensory/regulatory protein RpfC n=1 Tax=Mangrovibacterium marinum TaxID=1639118 RepID=A0A2T5BXL6_9BACT|nr:PAS domain S-box protein [Mangrovibacterium marinum]PTN05618.1 hypothetical protein C8N47_12637 [Mangrovibacterium marinum]